VRRSCPLFTVGKNIRRKQLHGVIELHDRTSQSC
jgi:hypothetical protein